VPHKNESYAVVVVTVKRFMTRCVIQSMNGVAGLQHFDDILPRPLDDRLCST